MNVTNHQVLQELRRELAKRHEVYPRWVAKGDMAQRVADERIACIERAIALIQPICGEPSLFPDSSENADSIAN